MTPADDQAAVRAAAPPFKPLAQKPPSVTVERRDDGSILVRSTHAPAEGPRSIAQLLADRAAAHPERPYLFQREPNHGPWRGVTYGQAKHAAQLGLDQPISGERIVCEAPLPEPFDKLLRVLRGSEIGCTRPIEPPGGRGAFSFPPGPAAADRPPPGCG